MTIELLSPQTNALLRFLVAPRSFQRAYVNREPAEFEYEGRESNCCVSGGLELVFLLGKEHLDWDLPAVDHAMGDESRASDAMAQLRSLIWFVYDVGEHLLTEMDNDDDEADTRTYANGMWRLLRRLAREVLEELGVAVTPPTLSYEAIFVSLCYAVPQPGRAV